MVTSSVPAAQYVRMSTEHQQYSMDNQSAAIARYAEEHGFVVVKTYADPARSGITLKQRAGLRQLLRDVVNGTPEFKVILVYDVSRWGRFQDMDESAHYEYLCRAAGIPVIYCAESFGNDMAGWLMKALKRMMAGEFSRELGVKVFAGQRTLASLGFKMGGRPPLGMRRMLLSGGTTPTRILGKREYKDITTDRVKLVHGPDEEVALVREMFRMLVEGGKNVHQIMLELNRRNIKPPRALRWKQRSLYRILTNPDYTGCYVWGRTSQKLRGPRVKIPREQWVIVPRAFGPIITEEVFAKAQDILQNTSWVKSNERVLDDLRKLWAEKKHLSSTVINQCPYTSSATAYKNRFGSLNRAYQLIACHPLRNREAMVMHKAMYKRLRQNLLDTLVALFPRDLRLTRKTWRYRYQLRLRDNSVVSVLVARAVQRVSGLRWILDPVEKERKHMTLVARLNEDGSGFYDYYLLPSVDRRSPFHFTDNDNWLRRGSKLATLNEFLSTVALVRKMGSEKRAA